jgi:hypothetical protein
MGWPGPGLNGPGLMAMVLSGHILVPGFQRPDRPKANGTPGRPPLAIVRGTLVVHRGVSKLTDDQDLQLKQPDYPP